MGEPIKYAINPLAPFPKRWRDHHGPITVMGEPIKGYVMCRRPGAAPFILSVSEILNATKHSLGPFELIEPKKAAPRSGEL